MEQERKGMDESPHEQNPERSRANINAEQSGKLAKRSFKQLVPWPLLHDDITKDSAGNDVTEEKAEQRYRIQFAINAHAAFELLTYFKENTENLTPKHFLGLHKVLFSGIYKAPGEYRTGKMNFGGWFPVLPEELPIEMDLAFVQFRKILADELISRSDVSINLLGAFAFLYARTTAIQPFVDGNKRTGRYWISGILGESVEEVEDLWADARAHEHALIEEGLHGNLRPLVNIMLRVFDPSKISDEPIWAPFRIVPPPGGERPYHSVDEALLQVGMTPESWESWREKQAALKKSVGEIFGRPRTFESRLSGVFDVLGTWLRKLVGRKGP